MANCFIDKYMSNMKFNIQKLTLIKLLLTLFLLIPVHANDLYYTRSGIVSFFSSTPIEDIKAANNQVTCVLQMETGKTSFRIPIRGFIFPNALMQEHFNENYLESEKFPNASFNGNIENWSEIKINKNPKTVTITGEMTIHGVTKKIKETGDISLVNGNIHGKAIFDISVADYNIAIPKILRENIAENVEITINLELNKK